MRPKFGVPKIRLGMSKFARLNTLKISQRNSSCDVPAERPRLGDRQIDVGESRPDHAVARRAAEGERRRQRERRRVEPPLGRSIAAGQIGIAELIGPLRRAGADVRLIDAEVDRERRAGLRGENGIDAPAAEGRFSEATGAVEERQLIDAARDELVPVIEARVRPLAGFVEDVAHVLWNVGFRLGGAGARGIVFRGRERVADVVREVVPQPPLGLERDAVVDRLAVEPDRIDAAQLRDRPPALNRARAGFGDVANGRVVGAERPRAHVGHLDHRRREAARTAGRRSTSGCTRRCRRSP